MLDISDTQLNALINSFFLPLFRIMGLIMTAPVFNNRALPVRIKLMLGLAIAMATVPALPLESTPLFNTSPSALIIFGLIAQQLITGLAIGFIMRVFFAAIDLAGEMIGLQMGLSFAVFFSPQAGGQSSVLAEFLNLLTVMIFLALNGHLMIIEIVILSFKWLPIFASGSADGAHFIARSAASLFVIGTLLALPMVAALLITNIALGILTRAAPQLNLFAVGFPVTLTLGFIVLFIGLNFFATLAQVIFETGFDNIDTFLKLSAKPAP